MGLAGRAGGIRKTALSALFAGIALGWSPLASSAQAKAPAQQLTPDYNAAQSQNPSQDPESVSDKVQNEAQFEDARRAYDAMQFDTALAIARKLGAQGNTQAQVMAGHILMNGKTGVIKDTEAAEWFRKASEDGSIEAYMGLGEMALKNRAGLTPKEALPWFSAAAQAGRGDAMRAIGEMYVKGIGIEKDADKGQVWLSKAADFGDGSADRKMADNLFENDPAQALIHYEKAAASGDAQAAYIAAIMYEENLAIKPNSNKMTALMHQAAQGGIAAAQADYGLLVYQGRGVTGSPEQAAAWFEKAAKGGDVEGQFLYAFTLAKGDGAAQDMEQAYYWLLKSGKSGVSDYDLDRKKLREALDKAMPAEARARAQARYDSEAQ